MPYDGGPGDGGGGYNNGGPGVSYGDNGLPPTHDGNNIGGLAGAGALIDAGGGIGVGAAGSYGGYGDAGGGGGGGDVVGVPPSMQGQVSAWCDALMINSKGILFEGGPIKVRTAIQKTCYVFMRFCNFVCGRRQVGVRKGGKEVSIRRGFTAAPEMDACLH